MDECFVRSMNHTPTYLFLPRENEDDVRDQKTLACEMFTSCFRPWLKNVASLSSLFFHVRGDTAFQQKEMEASSLVSSNWLAVVSFLSFCSHGPYKTVKTKEQEAPKSSFFGLPEISLGLMSRFTPPPPNPYFASDERSTQLNSLSTAENHWRNPIWSNKEL